MPKTIIYPTAQIDRQIGKLQRNLRSILKQYRNRQITKEQCTQDGEDAIKASYQTIRGEIQTYLARHGVKSSTTELTERLNQTIQGWHKIVDDT